MRSAATTPRCGRPGDRVVPFPQTFRETLALQLADRHKSGGAYLFESSWKKPYSTHGVRALLARYATAAGLPHNMPPHQSLEIYSRLALTDAQASYGQAIGGFPV
jgi:integrase/recombinase XerD